MCPWGSKRMPESRGLKDTRAWPMETTKQGSCGLTETKIASTRTVQVCTRSSVYILRLLAWHFCRTNSRRGSVSDSPCLFQRLFSSYWVVLASLDMRAFTCLTIFCFVLFGCCLSQAYSFLNKNKQRVDLE